MAKHTRMFMWTLTNLDSLLSWSSRLQLMDITATEQTKQWLMQGISNKPKI